MRIPLSDKQSLIDEIDGVIAYHKDRYDEAGKKRYLEPHRKQHLWTYRMVELRAMQTLYLLRDMVSGMTTDVPISAPSIAAMDKLLRRTNYAHKNTSKV